jgi:hypothetical protein
MVAHGPHQQPELGEGLEVCSTFLPPGCAAFVLEGMLMRSNLAMLGVIWILEWHVELYAIVDKYAAMVSYIETIVQRDPMFNSNS